MKNGIKGILISALFVIAVVAVVSRVGFLRRLVTGSAT